jgi:ribose transport system substrate-binding protein
VDGFTDALEATGQPFRILKTYSAVEPIAGAVAGKAILREFPKPGSVDVVFTVNDGGGLAVFEQLTNAGRTEIFGATVDGDPASVAAIRAGGIIRIDSAQFCGELGATALRTADALLRKQVVGRQFLVPVFPITAETEARYQGWVGGVPDSFTKPWPSENPTWSPVIQGSSKQSP